MLTGQTDDEMNLYKEGGGFEKGEQAEKRRVLLPLLAPEHRLGNVDEREIEPAEACVVHEPECRLIHIPRIDAVHGGQGETASDHCCHDMGKEVFVEVEHIILEIDRLDAEGLAGIDLFFNASEASLSVGRRRFSTEAARERASPRGEKKGVPFLSYPVVVPFHEMACRQQVDHLFRHSGPIYATYHHV